MTSPALPALSDTQERAVVARSTRRDDQTRETRRRLLAAAMELVAEVGWRRTTVEQIAERAGVAKGTFFVHFKAKEAIVVTLVQFQTATATAARDAVVAREGSAIERLQAATMTLGAAAATNIELSRAVLIASLESREVGGASDAVFKELHARMIEDAHEALAQGLIEGPDAETVAGLLMACYLGATLHWTSSPNAKPLAEVLRPLVDATLAALAPKTTARAAKATKAVAKKITKAKKAKTTRGG